ncbi:MAG: murein biosynthesis integral membrane protein MurJ [Candidatus Omnitrophota bacterium]
MNPQHEHTKKTLVKAAGVVSASTLLSRMSGLVRDVISAHFFGVSRVWDAFVYAFMIPNLLRRLIGEGALSSAFIPVYTQILNQKGKKEAERVANIVFSLLVTVLGGFLFCTHWIIKILLHYVTFSDKVTLALNLLLILFPYIFFLSLVALFMGISHCHKRFFIPSLTPLLLNIVWIGTIILFCSRGDTSPQEKITILAWGVLVAGFAQLVVNGIPLVRSGFSLRYIFDFKHPALVHVLHLMIPAALGFSITQLNIFVDLNLAFLLGDGANSALWYGNRLMQFPLGVFGIAMGTALLPTISHHVAKNNIDGLKSTLSFSLRSVFLIVIPASVGLIVLREPIVRLLFERGAFDSVATQRTAMTLLCYCLGLFAYSGIKLVVSAFYSLQDAKTPVKIGLVCMVLNLIGNIIFMQFLREAGLALATALSSTVNFILLIVLLRKKIGSFEGSRILSLFVRALGISVLMGITTHFFFIAYVPHIF